MRKTYYQKLGLEENASFEEINKAYSRLALIYHLYKNSGDNKFENSFNHNTTIHQTLSSPFFRYEYDTRLRKRRREAKQSENVRQGHPSIKNPGSAENKNQERKTKSIANYGLRAILIALLLKLVFDS